MELFSWGFRYVVENKKVILAEVYFSEDGVVEGWCPIDESNREEASLEALAFLPINLDDIAVSSYSWANHPEVVEEVESAYEEALLLALKEEEELEKRMERELAMVNGKVMFIIQKMRSESEAYQKAEEAQRSEEEDQKAAQATKEEALASIVFRLLRAPRLAPRRVAKPAPAPSALIQKWIERHQEPLDLSDGILELKVVNPNAFSGVLDRLINGVLHSFTYEEKGDKLNMAEKTLPKAKPRARGGNSKPKGKRPWRENH